MYPDKASFLAAIAAGDDTARLVFADWLQERGDPRGPWVRDPDIWPFMAPDATNPVPRLLVPVDGQIPERHEWLVRELGASAVVALLGATRDETPTIRCAAVEALGKIGPAAVSAAPELGGVLRDEDPRVRRAALVALYHMAYIPAEGFFGFGSDWPGDVRHLFHVIKEGNKFHREAALRILKLISPARGVIGELIDWLLDVGYEHHVGLFAALGRMGSVAGPFLTSLSLLIAENRYEPYCEFAIEAARQLALLGPSATPAVVAALCATDKELRAWLDEVAAQDESEETSSLRNWLRHHMLPRDFAADARDGAADLLARINACKTIPDLIPAMLARLRDPSEHVRTCVMAALLAIVPAE